MHNLWLSWLLLCVKYGSRLGIYKLLQLLMPLPRLFITSNHLRSSRFSFLSARCVLSRTLRTPRRAANKWDLWTVCNLVFLKTKSTLPSLSLWPSLLLLRHQLGRAVLWESERSLAGWLTGVWGPSLAGNPTMISMMSSSPSLSQPNETSASQPDELHQFATLLFACFLLQFAIHHLPFTTSICHCTLRLCLRLLDKFTTAANWFTPNEPRESSLLAVYR